MGQKAKSSTKKLFWNLNKTKMRVELSKKILLWRTSKSESPYVCNCKSGFNGHRCERISSSNYYSNDISAQPISAFVPAFSNGLQRPNSLSASQVKVTKIYKVNRPFNLHPEKWFEGYPVKSTQIFSGCSPDFFLFYKYDTQLFSGCPPEKKIWGDFTGKILKGRFYRVPFKSIVRVHIKRANENYCDICLLWQLVSFGYLLWEI